MRGRGAWRRLGAPRNLRCMIDRMAAATGSAARGGVRALALLMLLLLAAFVAPAAAQTAPPAASAPAAAQGVSADELERLVGTLQDDKQRAQLVEQLRALIAAQRGVEAQQPPSPASLLSDLSQRIDDISGEVVAAAGVVV